MWSTQPPYNLPPNRVKIKDVCAREQLKKTSPDIAVQQNIDLDVNILGFYAKQLGKVEWFIEQQAKQHNPVHLNLLRTVPGVVKG